MLIIMSVQENRLHYKIPWRVWFTPPLSLDWMVSSLFVPSLMELLNQNRRFSCKLMVALRNKENYKFIVMYKVNLNLEYFMRVYRAVWWWWCFSNWFGPWWGIFLGIWFAVTCLSTCKLNYFVAYHVNLVRLNF